MALLLQSVGQNALLAVTVIPLLILYFGLIAWLTFDASQDSNWFFWLLLFLFAGPVSIPFYILASLTARRWTRQEKLDELRRRMGQTYTLAELAAAYGDSERWGREVLEARVVTPGWPRDLTLVLAAAFDAYQRGATDYEP